MIFMVHIIHMYPTYNSTWNDTTYSLHYGIIVPLGRLRGGTARHLPWMPTCKGCYVTGIITDMVTVNWGFHTGKNFTANYLQFGANCLKNVHQPCRGAKKAYKTLVCEGSKLLGCMQHQLVLGWPWLYHQLLWERSLDNIPLNNVMHNWNIYWYFGNSQH